MAFGFLLLAAPAGPATCSGGDGGSDAGADAGTGGGTQLCGNNVLDPGEDCDGTELTREGRCELLNPGGFVGGRLACFQATCTFDTSACQPPRCGNGVRELHEQCDGADFDVPGAPACTALAPWAYAGGTARCDSDCKLDFTGCRAPVCGDGKIEAGETCELFNLNGKSCTDLGAGNYIRLDGSTVPVNYIGGVLGCGSVYCTYEKAGCIKLPGCYTNFFSPFGRDCTFW